MDLERLLALTLTAQALIARGVTTYEAIHRFFEEAGATPDELAAMRARLDDAIARRDAEIASGT